MMMKMTGKEYIIIKQKYFEYLATFKFLNKGSSEGAVSFDQFYLYRVYVSKYSDRKSMSQVVYR
jgi:hypothetical protein